MYDKLHSIYLMEMKFWHYWSRRQNSCWRQWGQRFTCSFFSQTCQEFPVTLNKSAPHYYLLCTPWNLFSLSCSGIVGPLISGKCRTAIAVLTIIIICTLQMSRPEGRNGSVYKEGYSTVSTIKPWVPLFCVLPFKWHRLDKCLHLIFILRCEKLNLSNNKIRRK